MSMEIFSALALTACLCCGAADASSLRVADVFSDHMVLQQKAPIPVWGQATPGETVTVRIGKRSASAQADADGRWKVTLKPLPAGGPYEMTVSTPKETLRFEDALVGEVWICSGQSNMEWPLDMATNGPQEVQDANHPQLRLFTVQKDIAAKPKTDCIGRWEVSSPKTAAKFSAVGYFFGRDVQRTLGVPVGVIHASWGGTAIQTWMSLETLKSDPDYAQSANRYDFATQTFPPDAKEDADWEAWRQSAREAVAQGKIPTPFPPTKSMARQSNLPTGLYNAMICPLAPYALRGAIWYQGETNASDAIRYRTMFPAMIADWRRLWGQGDFPFYYVQLANFMDRSKAPQMDSAWAELREAQLLTLSTPNVGMAVAIDVGEAKDIHPRNKQEVGHRLALAALAKTYKQRIPYSGPIYKSMRIKGDKALLSFAHTDKGLTAKDGALKGFAIAGADGHFVWADAALHGNKVEVRSKDVPSPVAVRYAWADNPDATLYNGAGLPASPFRTDVNPQERPAPPKPGVALPENGTLVSLFPNTAEWTDHWHVGDFNNNFPTLSFWAFKGDGAEVMRWKLAALKPGRYTLYAWLPADHNSDHATDATYQIRHAEGLTPVKVDQRRHANSWYALGAFTIDAASAIELSNAANGNVVADALAAVPAEAKP